MKTVSGLGCGGSGFQIVSILVLEADQFHHPRAEASPPHCSANVQNCSKTKILLMELVISNARSDLGLPMARRVGFFLGGSPDPVVPSSSF